MSKTVAILAASGAQQAAIAHRFQSDGWSVRGTSRQPAPGQIAADLETSEGLPTALAGADVAVLTLPQDHRPGAMLRLARTVSAAAAQADVGRLVLNFAATISETSLSDIHADFREARGIVRWNMPRTVMLQPTVFMDNLLAPWSLPAIAQGVLAYPAPEDVRISWISHRTLADFVLAAATADVDGADLHIGGPEALTPSELAELLGAHLGRSIVYQRTPLADFAAGLNQAFGAPAGDRIASLYANLQQHPSAMAVDGSAAARLGVAPESFQAFVERSAWG